MEERTRCYFVIDMKSFFASVECAERGLDPMKEKLVVADEERTEGTVCLAVTPALKQFGVKNRCRLFEIPKSIKFLVVKPRMKKYIEYASEIYAIYLKYIDKNDIHVYSIDESFLDVTDYLKIYKIKAKDFAKKLMDEIYDKLHIPCSVGIGTNLYLAKIALDITAKNSYDKIGWLTEEKFVKTLWNHKPLTDFWGISNGISNRLARFGIYDMEAIATADENILYKEFGINAELLIDHAFGRESCTMKDIKKYKTKRKSFSNSQILPKNYSFNDGKMVMQEMVQSGCYNLFKKGYVTKSIHLGVGYGDKKGDFAKGTRRLNVTTNLFSIIGKEFEKIFDEKVDKQRPIRKIEITFSSVSPKINESYDLLTDLVEIEKEKKLVKSILNVHEKYGKNSILKGIDYKKNATGRERNKMVGGHNAGEE